ncbi:hypothetical protein PV726_31185 [Streptomyces europaeiscabiei]|uniref:hypothetical protein n=1 Tax=Streptomyces europaeiscabiei TaxID=146819 RepID=UPI0029BCF539|nr:hypothetical protein [Streptomyces europaeiscabiei]MDX3694718.1 hypothetical protein [Streptomyces europaeiscabiei]
MPTDREASPAERGASAAIATYVSAGVLTQAEADHALRTRLRIAERVVRANCAGSFGNAWSYGAQVRQSREEWLTSSGRITRRRKLAALVQAEVEHAAYMAVRAEYKTPQQIVEDDAAAPVLATVPQLLHQVAEDLKARRAAEVCVNQTPSYAQIVPVNGRVVIRAGCECGGRHWRTLDLGPAGSLADAERLNLPLLGPSVLLRDQGVRTTTEFTQCPPDGEHAWCLRADARPDSSEKANFTRGARW